MYRLKKIAKDSSLILSCLLFSIQFQLYGQKHNILNFTTADGLPSQIVNDVFQDKDGFFWFATQDGVSIFNGYDFSEFAPVKELKNIDAVTVIQDKNGRILIGTNTSGLFIYDYKKITHLYDKNGLGSNVVRRLFLDKDKSVWALTSAGVYQLKDDKPLQFKDPKGLLAKGVLSMARLSNGDLWFGTQGNGLIKFSENKFYYFGQNDGVLDDYIFSLAAKNDTLLIGTTSQGVLLGVNNSFSQLNIPEINNAWISTFTNTEPYIEIVSSSGLIRYFSEGKYEYLTEANGLTSNDLYNGSYDRERNLWLSSGNGVSCLRKEDIISMDKETGLSDDKITCVTRLSNGLIACGTYGSGIDLIDNSSKVVSTLFPNELEGVKITVITEIKNSNEIWIGTDQASHSIFILDSKTGKVKKKINKMNGFFIQTVTRIEKDKQDRIWVGTFNAGLFVIDRKDTLHYNSKNALPSNEIYTFAVDDRGMPWVSVYQKGLYTLKNNKFERIPTSDKFILSILVGPSNAIYAGTKSSGLIIIKGEKIKTITTKDGLLSDNITSLTSDNDLLWVGTNRGVNLLRILKGSIVQNIRFDKRNGLKNLDIQQNAMVASKGILWYGSSNGISIIHGVTDQMTRTKPLVAINRVTLFFEDVDWSKFDDVKVDKYGIPTNVTLDYTDNHLTFMFCALTTGAANYTYKLEGHDNKWSPLSDKRDITYSNLSPGEYTFRVRSIDNYGVLSDIKEISILIKSPFWETLWFRVAAVLLILIIILAFIRIREKNYRERQIILENTVKERTSEVVQAYEKVEQQKQIVEDKNKEILDSITYAKRIQSAILPSEDALKEEFKDVFVLYRPKDIVAGDFYWFEKIGNKKLIAVADCTGHGVPGAMISVVCNNALNRSIREYGLRTPSKILDKTRDLILDEFSKYKEEVNDGMDITMLAYDPETNIIEWSGANISLLLFKSNSKELQEIKGDKMPVGKHINDGNYTLHSIQIEEGDSVYLTSDGFADQFGGAKGKKLKSAELKRLLEKNAGSTMEDQKNKLVTAFDSWKSEYDQVDDVCVIGIQF